MRKIIFKSRNAKAIVVRTEGDLFTLGVINAERLNGSVGTDITGMIGELIEGHYEYQLVGDNNSPTKIPDNYCRLVIPFTAYDPAGTKIKGSVILECFPEFIND